MHCEELLVVQRAYIGEGEDGVERWQIERNRRDCRKIVKRYRLLPRTIDGRANTIKRASMNFEDLKNPEFQEKLKSAKTVEELVAFAVEQGVELSDEQLEAV